jgi:hypothetical protein
MGVVTRVWIRRTYRLRATRSAVRWNSRQYSSRPAVARISHAVCGLPALHASAARVNARRRTDSDVGYLHTQTPRSTAVLVHSHSVVIVGCGVGAPEVAATGGAKNTSEPRNPISNQKAASATFLTVVPFCRPRWGERVPGRDEPARDRDASSRRTRADSQCSRRGDIYRTEW